MSTILPTADVKLPNKLESNGKSGSVTTAK